MDKRCYIVGAGEDFGLDFTPEKEDLVIAADGGYAKLLKAGLQPHMVIGDFDSLGTAPQDEQVITLPTVKDVTDTWAAVDWAVKQGYGEFHLYGCTGGRMDHTLANLQMAADLAAKGMHCLIFDKTQVMTAICGGMVFPAGCEGYLSVFSITDVCCGVTLKGLKYELENARLSNRFPLGVSNEFTGVSAGVTVGSGTALLVFDRKLYERIDKPAFMD